MPAPPTANADRAYQAPGVYLRPKPGGAADARLVRTDIAGFVGYAERGPLPRADGLDDPEPVAVRVTDWKQFVATFGRFLPHAYLAYAVRGFFENGGTTCYVVRVAATHHDTEELRPAPAVLAVESRAVADGPVPPAGFTIRARSPGAWGNRLRVVLTRLDARGTDFSLRVALETKPGQPREEEFYPRVSLKPYLDERNAEGVAESIFQPVTNQLVSPDGGRGKARTNQYAIAERVNAVSNLIQIDAPGSNAVIVWPEGGIVSGRLKGGRDGLSEVTAADFIGVADTAPRGLALLEQVEEVSILCCPDAAYRPPPARPGILATVDPCRPPVQSDRVADGSLVEGATAGPPRGDAKLLEAVQSAAVAQCERFRNRVVLVDPPPALSSSAKGRAGQAQLQAVEWRQKFATRYAAMYYPWLRVPDPLGLDGLTRTVPPCGHVAGVYAQIDRQYGVHEPPANVPLANAIDLADEVDPLEQGALNYWGVNAIRSFGPRGLRVWGARSLAPLDDGLWRFIHVRRLMSAIEQSVEYGSRWAAFEGNTGDLRRMLAHSVTVLLEGVWRKGGLGGDTADAGFYVRCDETNNPPAVVDAGQLVCQVGVAVVAATEFLVFTIHQRSDGAEVVEE